MPSELILQTGSHSVDKCLTNQCNECSGSYINRFTGYQLRCNCKCHNRKMLEQQDIQTNMCQHSDSESTQLFLNGEGYNDLL